MLAIISISASLLVILAGLYFLFQVQQRSGGTFYKVSGITITALGGLLLLGSVVGSAVHVAHGCGHRGSACVKGCDKGKSCRSGHHGQFGKGCKGMGKGHGGCPHMKSSCGHGKGAFHKGKGHCGHSCKGMKGHHKGHHWKKMHEKKKQYIIR